MADTTDDLVTDIRELIRRPIGDFELPSFKLLPVKHYFGKVVDVNLNGRAKPKEDGKEGTPCWVFYVTPTEPGPDFESEDLKFLKDQDIDLGQFKFPTDRFLGVNPATIWLHPKTMGNAREFFENMGFPTTKPMQDCANEMLGKRVLMGIGLEESQTQTNTDGTKRKYNVLISLTGDPRG